MLAAEELSELIDLIHDAAQEPAHWPRLLHRLATALLPTLGAPDGGGAPGTSLAAAATAAARETATAVMATADTVTDAEAEADAAATDDASCHAVGAWLTRCLQRHLERALRQQQELDGALAARDAVEQVFERLPLAIALVDPHGQVRSLNQALLALCRSHAPLRLQAHRLVVDGADAARWSTALAAAVHDEQVLRLDGAGGPVTVWMRRLPAPADRPVAGPAPEAPPLLLVLAAAAQAGRALAAPALQALWGLSPAEARLTQQLALGRSVDEACDALDIRTNTARTHLKRIFAKVGVHRQSELVQAIYASPLWLTAPATDEAAADTPARPRPALAVPGRDAPGDHRSLRLADGRRLSYSDSGDPRGRPLLLMHGLAGSRLLRPPDDEALLQRGLRLIIAERPGCGDSDPQPGRRIADWPDDVAELIDHLGLAQVRLLGYSAGTPYAIACALAWPRRVEQLALVAPVCPIDQIADLRAYPPTAAAQLLLARHAPGLLPALLGLALRGLRGQPYRHVEQGLALAASASDRAVYQDPRLRAAHVHGLLTGIRGGTAALAHELALYAGNWDLDPGALRLPTPVPMWHGDADPMVALDGARRLAERIPGARLQVIAGAGHLLLYSHWHQVLDGLLAAHPAAHPPPAPADPVPA